MKLTRSEEITLPQGTLTLNDRRGSRDYYTKYLVGRSDIAMVQFYGVCNAFFGVNGLEQIDFWTDVQADKEMQSHICKTATEIFNRLIEPAYIQSHKEFSQAYDKSKTKVL